MSSTPSTVDLHSIELDDTIGALQIGSVFGVFLFGVVSMQTWNYFNTYRDDSKWNKLMVAAVWLLELGHTIAINIEVYRATIVLYGRPWLLIKFPGIGAAVLFSGVVTLVVQLFFSRRLAKLLPRPYSHIGWICIAVSSVRFVGTVYLSIEGITSTDVAIFRERLKWLVSATFVASAAVDIVIAIAMLWYIAKQKKQVKRISRLLDRLVTFTIRSGLLTSIAAILLLLCFLLMPTNFIWLAVYSFVVKLYSSSFLSALNARQALRRDMASTVTVSAPPEFALGERSTRAPMQNFTQLSTQSRPVIINMQTTRETIRDTDLDSPDLDISKQQMRSYNEYEESKFNGYAV